MPKKKVQAKGILPRAEKGKKVASGRSTTFKN